MSGEELAVLGPIGLMAIILVKEVLSFGREIFRAKVNSTDEEKPGPRSIPGPSNPTCVACFGKQDRMIQLLEKLNNRYEENHVMYAEQAARHEERAKAWIDKLDRVLDHISK